ncbi:hypothetical protein OIU84_008066 [Salix udensis]|uniref:Aluminum-activated malate transporter 9 n=1 Tax=Salix udensis TaxID=889485 RepID=A0AAD6JU84_9ROSI|nr:hypothetical protein OIU84_008066 [Salix udensis]
MARKMGSFRHSLLERRERLLSTTKGYSEIVFPNIQEDLNESTRNWCSYRFLSDKIVGLGKQVQDFAYRGYQMGKSDPRKIVFSAKLGLALMLISLLIFLKEPIKELSQHFVWAILTVVVVFEFSIGATFSKGLNRGIGTLSAGGLALAMAELSHLAGAWEEAVIILSIFSVGFCATYAKLYPSMKPYEYGFRVFLLTYCFIMVSGYRTGEFIHTAISRFLLIALGAGVGLAVNILIYPIWAGEDLHALVAKNFTRVATSLEGCVNEYLNCTEYERIPSKILTYQASDDPLYSDYRAAVESTSQEDALMGFAIWEPPHGPYRSFNYPWKNYVKVSGALRHCAFMVMALHGCILSEIQAPAERRQVFHHELKRVGAEGARVLLELGNKSPGKLGIGRKELGEPQDLLTFDDDENKVLEYKSRSEAVLDLRSMTMPKSWDRHVPSMDIKPTFLPSISSDDVFKKQISWPSRNSFTADTLPQVEESKTYESASALSLATFTSLLIEFVARLQNLVDSFEELSERANFKEPIELPLVTEANGFWIRLHRSLKFWK